MIDAKNDIYGIIRRLRASKINYTHAEAIANEISRVTNDYHSNDYLDLKFKDMNSKLDNKLQLQKVEILKWFIGVSVIQTISVLIAILAS